MKYGSLVRLLTLLFSFTLPQALQLNPDSSHSIVWSANCDGCASVEKLRATAYGIEIAPDYISLAIKHPNGTLAPLLKIDPGKRFQNLTTAWMRTTPRMTSLRPRPGLEVLIEWQHQIEIIADGLRQLLFETEKRFPGTEIEYGGISMPDFVYRDDVMNTIVQRAINSTSLRSPKYAEHFLLYPADFTVAATTFDVEAEALLDSLNFDALIVTNTSSFLSASWYQFSIVQHSIGQSIKPRADFPYLTRPYTFTIAAPKYGKPTKPVFVEAKPDLSLIRTFVKEREDMYKERKGAGKRVMSGKSRLVLRLNNTSDDAIHSFAKELNNVLKGSRFDPASTTTTVYREETSEESTWAPALYVAKDVKRRVDSATPYGCTVEHSTCTNLKDCIKQEALGDLVLCEEAASPQATVVERIERIVQGGSWNFWKHNFFSWTDQVFENGEARLWLVYCKDGMPWSGPSSLMRCNKAIVDIGNSEQGVLEDYLGVVNSVIYALAKYWIDGDTTTAVISVPVFWMGTENLLKVAVWVVSKMLGKEWYGELVEHLGDLWEMDLQPLLETFYEESNKGKKAG